VVDKFRHFDRELYEQRYHRDLQCHVEFLFCEPCCREFDPFACVIPKSSARSLVSEQNIDLGCPICNGHLGFMTTSKHCPFVVYTRDSYLVNY
jgi:hypothetical protein